MVHSRAASRYVKSLLGLAVEKKVLDEVHRDMLLFSKVCDENRSFELLLQNPIIRHHKKLEILQKIFKGKVQSLTMSFLDIITRKNRESILADIAKEFHNAYNTYKGIGKATVITHVPLDASLRAEFEKLAKHYSEKKEVELTEKVDSDMIGGFVLNVGDRQLDASIKNKIKTLKLKFSQNPYIKEL